TTRVLAGGRLRIQRFSVDFSRTCTCTPSMTRSTIRMLRAKFRRLFLVLALAPSRGQGLLGFEMGMLSKSGLGPLVALWRVELLVPGWVWGSVLVVSLVPKGLVQGLVVWSVTS